MNHTNKNNPTSTYIKTIETLEEIFDFFNCELFESALEKPVITVCQDRRGRAYGWMVPKRIWKENPEEDGAPEINMCSQYLNRSFEETAQTMLHEMCHLFAFLKGIPDTSANGNYHNRNFKTIAEEHGLSVNKSRSNGYSRTAFTEESKKMLSKFMGSREFMYDIRPRASKEDFIGEAEKEARENRSPIARHLYSCPTCGQKVKVYSISQKLLCATCNVPFEKQYI